MKNIINFTLLLFLLGSCSSQQDFNQENLKQEILVSKEFSSFKNSYNDYYNYRLSRLKELMINVKTSKISKEEYTELKEDYNANCTDKMQLVWQNIDILKKKYPNMKEVFTIDNLFDYVREDS